VIFNQHSPDFTPDQAVKASSRCADQLLDMPNVIRDTDGRIIGLAEQSRESSGEELSLSDPEVQAFLHAARKQLSTSDSQTIRVIEDLVDVLIKKGVILPTDLPDAARHKLSWRQQMRSDLNVLDNLMVDEDDIL
jgi:hypothetical protein